VPRAHFRWTVVEASQLFSPWSGRAAFQALTRRRVFRCLSSSSGFINRNAHGLAKGKAAATNGRGAGEDAYIRPYSVQCAPGSGRFPCGTVNFKTARATCIWVEACTGVRPADSPLRGNHPTNSTCPRIAGDLPACCASARSNIPCACVLSLHVHTRTAPTPRARCPASVPMRCAGGSVYFNVCDVRPDGVQLMRGDVVE